MRYKYCNHQTIKTDDYMLLLALIARHPEAIQKIGCGIKRFFVAPDSEQRTQCFWLERYDGTQTDFSYVCAVKANLR